MTENKAQEEDEDQDDEDDDFGDFESATDESPQQQKDWDVLSNQMESLNVNKTSSSSPPSEDEGHLVRAVKTKEEEEFLKQKHDYVDEEQEGEV
jgi:hypothetical protein